MGRNVLFVEHEATISLYREAASGEPESTAVWIGACAERVGLRSRLGEVRVAPMGGDYPVRHHDDLGEHEINIERLWVIPRANYTDYALDADGRYVLDILWATTAGEWHKRRYYGVLAGEYNIESNGIMEFMATQTFTAERYVQTGGETSSPDETALASIEATVPFFLDTTCMAGRYMLGHYRWTTPMRIVSALVHGRASQGADTVFGLEIDGVLSAHAITLPAGAINEEVSAEATLDVELDSLSEIRWKVISAPVDTEDCAHVVGLSVRLEPVDAESETLSTAEQAVAYFRDGSAMKDLYVGGDYQWRDAMQITAVVARGHGASGLETELTLEIDSVLTAITVNLPAGPGETSVELDLPASPILIGALSSARWKITNAPAAAEDCATGITVTMSMTPA